MTKSSPKVLRVLIILLMTSAGIGLYAGVAAGADLVVYGDSLNPTWSNWSWSTTANFTAASPVYNGSRSLAVTVTGAWGGLYLAANQTVNASAFDTLQFWVHGGSTGGQRLRVLLADGSYSLLTDQSVDVPISAGTWTLVKILLSDLGGPGQIGGIVWQDNSGGPQPAFYLDDVSFTNQGSPPPPDPTPGAGPVLSINVAGDRHAISEDIYGMNFADEALAAELRLPVRRWGGNSTTRYNWQTSMHNVGSDWYFENILDGLPVADGSASDRFVDQDRRTDTRTLMTVPLIGWTPKPSSPGSHPYDCGFKVSKYGAQQSTDPWDSDCGNGVRTNNTTITGNAPTDTSLSIGPEFVSDWIRHLVAKYGTAEEGGVAYYNLDNEPMLWNSTHRDVHPQPATYDELRSRTIDYGAAVKAIDPTARTLGPVLWGWCAYFYSAADGCSAGTDYTGHGNTPFVPWYLQQMNAYEQSHGVRILDYLDLHYYPQASGVALSSAGSSATQALRLRSTRSLWDGSYKDESWISDTASGGVAVQFIPRMKAWVDANYPGTRLAITEYNWGALDHINGALAQADVLGIFGREGLDLATLWGPPAASDPGAYAFRMFRNVDGSGSRFGDMSVEALSTDADKLAVYAAERTTDHAVTVMVINKTASSLTSTIGLSGFTPQASATVHRYSGSNPRAIERVADQAVTSTGFEATFPANSITLFALLPDSSPPPNVTVVVSPQSTTVETGKTLQFTAKVTGAVDTTVSWQVNGVAGGNASIGTITGSGLYTAPASVPSPASVTVSAVSKADSTKSGTATINIVPPPVTIALSPASATVETGKTQQFTAQVSGSTNTAVAWKVNGTTGGNATVGTISNSGLYTAPSSVPNPATVIVAAVSNADPTKSASATVTVTPSTFTSVKVLSPNGGEILPAGSTFVITWGAPSTAMSFRPYYSLNNGTKWQAITTARVTGSSYTWKVPTVAANTASCQVRVVAYDARGRQLGLDQSDAPFTIQGMTLTTPNGGETLRTGVAVPIAWTTYSLSSSAAKTILSLTKDGGVSWQTIATLTGNPGSWSWTPTASETATNCRIQVTVKDARARSIASDTSDAGFTLLPPTP